MAGSVLKEFVIKLGFRTDEAQQRRFKESIEGIGKQTLALAKNFAALGASVATTGIAAAVALNKIAKPLEGLYFASQRTGATAKELKTLQVAFEQIGISAEDTQSSIEAFSAARRSQPGFDQLFHIDPRQTDDAKNFLKVLEQIAAADTGGAFTHALAAQRAAMFGASEQTLTMFEKNRAEFNRKILPQQQNLVGKFKLDEMAKESHKYASGFRNAATNTELLTDKIATGVMPAGEKVLETTIKLEDVYSQIDDKTGGWLGHLTAAAGVSTGILATWKAIAALRGLGAATTVAEGAGAAAAGGGGLLATSGLFAIAAAAVAAAIAIPIKSTLDAYRGAKKAIGDGTLSGFVASFEGHAKAGYGLYKDIAGNLTAGFGHLVRPGENFAGLNQQGAQALLSRDLQSASDSVKKLVHVALTGNQMKALTDFVFNLGAGNLEKSTLLKELNAGHYEAAAQRFQDFDKIRQGGHLVPNAALADRRATEAALFRTPDKHVTNNVEIIQHIDGSGDPKAVGRESARQINQNLTRNLQPGVS